MKAGAARARCRRRAVALCCAASLWCIAVLGGAVALGPAFAASVPEPSGYRMEEYRAPVPAGLTGATVLDTAAAEALWRSGTAVFIDAMPRPVKPANLPAGTVWHDKPRISIKGAHWLINTGYGKLSPEVEAYLESRLATLTKGDKAATLVFFCEPECWMSWNAAKRALSLGYTDVRWYPGGGASWAEAGLPTVEAVPEP